MKSGMKVGLGTGSTAAFAVARLGDLLKSGELTDIVAVPTSIATEEQARGLGIPLATLDEVPKLDVAIDGADEVDPALNVVKGRGGALLREKMVEKASSQVIEGDATALGGRRRTDQKVGSSAVRVYRRREQAGGRPGREQARHAGRDRPGTWPDGGGRGEPGGLTRPRGSSATPSSSTACRRCRRSPGARPGCGWTGTSRT